MRLLLAIALAGNVAVAVAARHFPYEDVPNHLTRYVMMDRYWSGTAPSYIKVHLVPGAYVGIDLIGVALVRLVGPVQTARIMGAVLVICLTLGTWALLLAVGRDTDGSPEERRRHSQAVGGWALATVPIGLGFFPLVGFMNYTFGVAFLFVWMAIWWPARANASPARLVVLALGAWWLFLVHLSAPLMMLVVVWTDWIFAGAGQRRSRVPVVVVSTASVVAIVLWAWAGVPPMPSDITDSSGIVFKSLGVKIRNILSPFFDFTFPQMAVTLGAYLVGLWLYLRENRHAKRWNTTLLWSIGSFAVLYAIFPANTPGTGYLDMRWLLPVFLLPFAAVVGGGRPPTALAGWILVACSLVNAGVTWEVTRPIDRELDDFATVLDEIPPGHNLLPLVADSLRHGLRIFPYRHFAFWYMIERGGRVPVLFNYTGDGGGAPRQSFMSHFSEVGHLYTLPPSWGTIDFTPLDWTRVDHDYDYIVVAGRDPRVLDQVAPRARLVTRVGDITLFQTDPALVSAGSVTSSLTGSGSPVAEPSGGSAAPHAGERPIP